MKKTLLSLAILCGLNANGAQKTEGGRFQLIQLGDMRRDQYLLDTQTGKLWTPVCQNGSGADCDYKAFMEVDVEQISISKKEIYKKSEELRVYIEKTSKPNN